MHSPCHTRSGWSILAALVALLAFTACTDLFEDFGAVQTRVVIKVFDGGNDNEQLGADLEDTFSISRVEFDFNTIQFNSQQGDTTSITPPDAPVAVTSFDSDITITEDLIFDAIFHSVEFRMGSGAGDAESEQTVGQSAVTSPDPQSAQPPDADLPDGEQRDNERNQAIDDKAPGKTGNHSKSNRATPMNQDEQSPAIRIEGTFNDEEFTYVYDETLALDFDLSPPFSVSGEEDDEVFRFRVDYSGWFHADDGSTLLDPAEPEHKEQILENILHSFFIDEQDRFLTISDAEANRSDDVLPFTIHLSEAHTSPVHVDYETADQSAQAGRDYEATSGTLTFEPGETEKTIDVALLGASFNARQRAFRMELSDAEGARLQGGDSRATGTINNE